MHDISDSPFWQSIRDFLKSEYHLVFATYIDWFNPLGNKTAGKSRSCGALVLYCLNLPLELQFLQENVFPVCLIPLPHEATVWSLGHLLPHFVEAIMEFNDPGQVLETWSHPEGAYVAARAYPSIADLMASKKWIGFGSPQSNYYCTYCNSHREDIDNLDYESYIPRDTATVKNQAKQWRDSVIIEQKQKLHVQTGIQYSPILEIPYFDPVQHTVLGVMHNRLEGDAQYHLRVLWGIGCPDSQQKAGAKEMADLQQMETEDEGEYSETDTEEAGSELEELKDETINATDTSIPAHSVQNINLSDGNTTPTQSQFPLIGSFTSLRPPINLGEKEHGKLKAHEYLVLFTVIFPLIIPELWNAGGDDDKRHLECFFHLVASTNIAMSYTTSDSEADKYIEHYVQYRNIIKSLYSCWNAVPNHHYGMHIGSLLKFWGPLACLSEFPGERLNGEFAKIQTNNHYSEYE
ncbi:hypothetical protein GYMLUDRAFT_139418, partial [Collybiopsis luxurians FD-317 M1]